MATTAPNASPAWSFPCCPEPPVWTLDWDELVSQFDWLRALAGCPQDPQHHAEGDALVHTRMVCESLSSLEAWRGLSAPDRAVVFAAALMHDVAKPACTKEESGRIVSPGHARRGTLTARHVLWRLHAEESSPDLFAIREMVVGLVRHHGAPLWFLHKPDPRRAVIAASQTARCDWLALVAEADARGRECGDQAGLLERVELFREFAGEHGCLDRPRPFPSGHARYLYFSRPGADPDYDPFDDTRFEVVLMSGLPGAGKDTWIGRNLPGIPVISLDAIRRELRVDPSDDQGQVVQEAKNRARQHLHESRHFVWNATNTTRMLREQLIQLFYGYAARVRIVYVETSWNELMRRNQRREHPLPEAVLEKLAGRLEVPDLTEAHGVDYCVGP